VRGRGSFSGALHGLLVDAASSWRTGDDPDPVDGRRGVRRTPRKDAVLHGAHQYRGFRRVRRNLLHAGSIFNLAPTPNALAVWGLFGLALAYHFGIRLVLAAGLVSILGWITATTNSWRGWWWVEFERRPEEFMLAGLLIALLPLFIKHVAARIFPAVYRLVGMIAFFMTMLFLSAEGQRSYLPLEDKAVEHFYQMFGVVAAAGSVWIGVRKNWTGVINTGTAFFTIFLFFRLIDWWWDWMPKYLFFLLIGLVAIGLVAVFKRLRGRTSRVVA